ncbi:MAG: thioredoxin family protein [Actinomycetota bacterium]
MTRLVVLVVLAAVAVAIALFLQRRRPDPPSAPSYRAPAQLDRDDFSGGDHPVLAVVFASTTCQTCPEVWAMIEPLASDLLAVERVDVQDRGDLHQRYRIDGVPTTLLVDPDGVVTKAYFGPMSQEELDDGLAANGLRRPT